MNVLQTLVLHLIETWTRLYTLGLPAAAQVNRRHVVASDLWEQASYEGASLRTTLSLASRSLRGLPDDVAWRLTTGGLPGSTEPVEPREPVPGNESLRPGATAFVLAIGASITLVMVVRSMPYSLGVAGLTLALASLVYWTIDLRSTADEPRPDWSPLGVATGLGAASLGLVFAQPANGLLMAPVLAFVTIGLLRGELATHAYPVAASGVLPAGELKRMAATGAAIATEAPSRPGISRRDTLRFAFWLGLGGALAATLGQMVDFLWERKPSAFGGTVSVGLASSYPPGSKTKVFEGKFWLVNLTTEQGGPGFLALWQKCPHLGCAVPWDANYTHVDAETGASSKGWFRCPCHGSTYTDAGVRVAGPAPRSLDLMKLQIDPDTGRISVDTGAITKGTTENASLAVRYDRPS